MLAPGLDYIHQRTGIEVSGVLPFDQDLKIPEEDSVALQHRPSRFSHKGNRLRLAIIKYPHISNYDEFLALENCDVIDLVYTDHPNTVVEADFVILPGSKKTLADLEWLRAKELDYALNLRLERQLPIMGICGGYQMLGREITDELGSPGRYR